MAPKSKAAAARSSEKSKISRQKSKQKKNGTTPRRVRRKCTVPDCPNRVVQGGVCVTHGAVRKICQVPGCDKAVKIAGCCSTHGPARRRCDHEGCTRVAVQGGKCLSHGARRRVCKYPGEGGCNKNAIVGGMCKKHHDMMNEANTLTSLKTCIPIVAPNSADSPEASAVPTEVQPVSVESEVPMVVDVSEANAVNSGETMTMKPAAIKPAPRQRRNHTRGLSLFDDILTVDAIINSSADNHNVLGDPEPVTSAQPLVHAPPPSVVHASAPPVVQAPAPPMVRFSAPRIVQAPAPPTVGPPVPALVRSTTAASFQPPPFLPTKTPQPQVTFATGLSSFPPSNTVEADDYFSPTLAIFEQMIEASNMIEASSALSQPILRSGLKLSPRWSSPKKVSSSQYQPASVAPLAGPTYPASVVRKVSSNNIIGETQLSAPVAQASSYVGQSGPASNALAAAMADDDLNRTVSHDVEDVLLMSPKRAEEHSCFRSHFETPALCEPSPNPTIVSASSPHVREQYLPKPRPARQVFDHLFIP